MRIVADENISGTVIQELRQLGRDVFSVKDAMRSSPDEDILARAQGEHRLVLTHDKDFGELALPLILARYMPGETPFFKIAMVDCLRNRERVCFDPGES